jgi:hypothetical protein
VSGVCAQEKSAEEIAKELANPASSLASISTSLQYTTYDGDSRDPAIRTACRSFSSRLFRTLS